MAKAGYLEEVYVRTDTTAPSASDKIDGILEFNLVRSSDMLETTDFKNGTGYKERIQGLKDTSIDMSGHYEASDTIQALLRTAYSGGSDVYVTIYVDPAASAGSKGFRTQCKVESYESKGSVNGTADFSCKLVGLSAPVAV
jgi:predicted secreted protein